MHLLSQYGSTWEEVESLKVGKNYTFINQNSGDSMQSIFAKTVSGFSDYVAEIQPDLIVVHGDRIESLAGASVGALSGIRVAHIEGGELSGTIDEVIRHAVTKLSHLHFVSNDESRRRVVQLGENPRDVYVIGSPEVDVMSSADLPDLAKVKNYYELPFENYGILLFHPVTTEIDCLEEEVRSLVDFVIQSQLQFIVIQPNNDPGAHTICEAYMRFSGNRNFRVFPSMRFEYFLTALKHSEFIIGNSSAGVREAPYFGVPAINVGTRQHRRSRSALVINSGFSSGELQSALNRVKSLPRLPEANFGQGGSASRFLQLLKHPSTWTVSVQKIFVDQ